LYIRAFDRLERGYEIHSIHCGCSNGKTLLAAIEAMATFRAASRMDFATATTEECPMTTPAKILFTAKVHTTGGREGAARSSDGRLDVKLSSPGTAGSGTNPEQLFAAGWSACFEGAMGIAARKLKIALPADLAIDAEVDLCVTDGAFFLQARLNVSLPGVERDVAQTLVDAAHQTCPYSKAIRGNVDVVITLV
jgi:lipoyl-dependent peroxiredoxin